MPIIDDNEWFNDVMSIAMSDEQHSVLLYVAMNVDSLCTCVMLTSIFKTNNIQYQIIPLQSYADFFKHQKKLLSPSNTQLPEVYSMYLFINAGAMIDLTEFASTLYDKTTNHIPHIFVLDSHRPIHLANVFHKDQEGDEYTSVPINIIAHDAPDMEYLTTLYKMQLRIERMHEDEEEQRGQRNASAMEDIPDEDAFFDEDDAEEMNAFIVDDQNNPDILPMEDDDGAGAAAYYEEAEEDGGMDDEEEKTAVDLYYEETRYGLPSVVVLFRALNVNSKTINKNDLLWWAIIGLTEYLIMDRIEAELYKELVQEFAGKVSAWNADKRSNFNVVMPGDDDDAHVVDHNKQEAQQRQSSYTLSIPSSNDTRIKFLPEEFVFFCYRHMPFLQSMMHTTQVFCSFYLWDPKGVDELKYHLSKTGVSLEQLDQRWRSMKKQSRLDLRNSILKGDIDRFAQIDPKISSFCKNYGMDFKVSALDMVYVLLTLLESVNDTTRKSSASLNKPSMNFADAFGAVYDALHGNVSVIRKGIDEAIAFQRTLVQQCKELLSARNGTSTAIKTVGSYYSAKLERPDPAFLHPFALTRLGLFILAISRARGLDRKRRNHRSKPIVISAINQEKHLVTVVGIDINGGTVNTFRSAFESACERTNVSADSQSFDTHVLQLKSVDLGDFLTALYAAVGAQKRRVY